MQQKRGQPTAVTIPHIIDVNGRPITRERRPFTRHHPYPATDTNGHVNPDDLCRILTQMQDSAEQATAASRSSPLQRFVIIEQVPLTANILITTPPNFTAIFHNLGSPYTYYQCLRTRQPPGQGVTGFTNLIGGSGYTSAPQVTISPPPKSARGLPPGSQAQAVATVSGGAVTNLVFSSGFGYLTPPTISFTGGGGTGASATAVLGFVSSQPFAFQELPMNLWPGWPQLSSYTPDRFLLVNANSTGLYDIAIYCD